MRCGRSLWDVADFKLRSVGQTDELLLNSEILDGSEGFDSDNIGDVGEICAM